MNPRLNHWKGKLTAALGVEPYTECEDMRILIPLNMSFTPLGGEPRDIPGTSPILLSLTAHSEWPAWAVDMAVSQFLRGAIAYAEPLIPSSAQRLKDLLEEVNAEIRATAERAKGRRKKDS